MPHKPLRFPQSRGESRMASAGKGASQTTGDKEPIAHPGSAAQDRASRRHAAEDGDIDHHAGRPDGIAPDEGHAIPPRASPQAFVERIHESHRGSRRKAQGHHGRRGDSPHGRDVADITGQRLPADPARGGVLAAEVRPLHEHIAGEEQIPSTGLQQDGRIVPDPDTNRWSRGDPAAQPLDQPDLAKMSDRRRHRSAFRVSAIPMSRLLWNTCTAMGAQSEPLRS